MASAVICPACQTRNRATWALCARCGDSLEGARPAEVATPAPSDFASPDGAAGRDFGSLYLLLMFAILFGTVAVACRDITTKPPAPAASPGVFTFGGQPVPAPSPASPSDSDAETGRRLLAQRRAAEAVPYLERAVAAEGGDASLHHVLGRAYWESGNREAAVASYEEAARVDPESYRLDYAQSLETVGRRDEALAEMEAVAAAKPGSAIVQEGLSRLYYDRGEFARALPFLEAVAAQTRDPAVLQKVGYAAERAGDRERAVAAYRDVLAIEPRATVARGLLADALVASGQADEAVSLLQEGVRQSPQAPNLQRDLGGALERSGRASEAAAAYREYARLAPNAPDARELAERAARLEGPSGPSGS